MLAGNGVSHDSETICGSHAKSVKSIEILDPLDERLLERLSLPELPSEISSRHFGVVFRFEA